jgi:hypothetical protein
VELGVERAVGARPNTAKAGRAAAAWRHPGVEKKKWRVMFQGRLTCARANRRPTFGTPDSAISHGRQKNSRVCAYGASARGVWEPSRAK